MADLKLISYIRQNMAKGYTEAELRKVLKENGWSALEIDESFDKINKPEQQPKSSSNMHAKNPVTEIPSQLVSFVRTAFQKGIDEQKITQALQKKGWKSAQIQKAITLGKPNQQLKSHEELKQKIDTQPNLKQPKQLKQKTPLNSKKILIYALSSLGLLLVLSLTIGLYFNILGLSNYTIVDPSTGEVYTGRCLTTDCSAMKSFAWDYMMGNLYLILGIAAGATALFVLLFALISKKRALIIWIFNILFLVFLLFIGYTWARFRGWVP